MFDYFRLRSTIFGLFSNIFEYYRLISTNFNYIPINCLDLWQFALFCAFFDCMDIFEASN